LSYFCTASADIRPGRDFFFRHSIRQNFFFTRKKIHHVYLL